MQERYSGDIHDFFKLNFLEFISHGLKEKKLDLIGTWSNQN